MYKTPLVLNTTEVMLFDQISSFNGEFPALKVNLAIRKSLQGLEKKTTSFLTNKICSRFDFSFYDFIKASQLYSGKLSTIS